MLKIQYSQDNKSVYLLEIDKTIKIVNGKMKYTLIQHYKNHSIKFNTNGVHDFCIFRGSTLYEDNISSIQQAKNIIDSWENVN